MAKRSFDELVQLMRRLRAPGGCPWDREQTMEDLRAYVVEEAYEVTGAINDGDMAGLREELGDFLLQAVFLAEIAEEQGEFDVYDSIGAIHDKLVARHPHVFADVIAETPAEVLANWEKLKSAERKEKGEGLMSGVPPSLPALLKAMRLTEKAANVGFDWEKTEDVFEKIDEEIEELKVAIRSDDRAEIEHEVGDLLFTVCNIARRLDIQPEEALQATNRRFTKRFEHIERRLREDGKAFGEVTLGEMDALWDEAKKTS
jgi:tetrapyrrole methylase family protein / MazG family protein